MKTHDSLIKLIASLDRSEKGYFRKYSMRHTIGEKNIYLRLFDLIDKDNETDLTAMKNKLSDYTQIKNFSVLKNYLYEMILKSMRSYEADKTPDSKINSYLDNSDYLRKKNLLNEAKVELRKAGNIAYSLEKYERLQEILKREIIICKRINPVDTKSLNILYDELEVVLEKAKNSSAYRKLNDIAFAILHRHGTNLKVLNKNFRIILDDSLMVNVNNAITYDAKLSFYQIYSAYYYANNEFEKTYDMYEKILKVMESNSQMLSEYSRGYIIILNNCMDVCDRLGRMKLSAFYQQKAERYLKEMRSNVNPESRHFLKAGISISKIINKIVSGDYDANDNEVKKIADDFETNGNLIPAISRITLMFQLSIYYFGCNDHSRALHWNNRIINGDESIRNDLIVESRLLFLIIHLELNNYDLLSYAVNATERYLNKKKPLIGIEQLFLKFIRRMSNIKDPSDMKILYIELKDNLKNKKDLLEEYAFDYLSWVESKTSGISFAIIKRQKHLKGEIR